MELEDAISLVHRQFPFAGYTEPHISAYRNIGRTLKRHLGVNASILEFGSGPCDKAALAAALGYRVSACDDLLDDWHQADGNRDKILDFARRMSVDFHIVSGNRLDLAPGSFDMIMLHDVLEHLHDSPRDLLNDLLVSARDEGLLFITVPSAVNIRKRLDVLRGRTNLPHFDGFYWYPGPWRGHIREYTKGDLEKLSEFLDLDVLELRGCDHMVHRFPPPLRSLYLWCTAPFPNLKDTWTLVARKRPGWRPKKSVSPEQLRKILNTRCPHPLYRG